MCEQQRRRSARASAQSDQRLCCSLPRQNDTSSWYIRNFKILAGLCSWAGQFVSCLVGDSRRHIFSWRGSYGPRQANLVLIAYTSSEGSGEPAHPRSLARTFAARSYKQWIKRNFQTENQIPGPSEWLGMRSWNLSWRNARRHKFAWRGSYINYKTVAPVLGRYGRSMTHAKVNVFQEHSLPEL